MVSKLSLANYQSTGCITVNKTVQLFENIIVKCKSIIMTAFVFSKWFNE